MKRFAYSISILIIILHSVASAQSKDCLICINGAFLKHATGYICHQNDTVHFTYFLMKIEFHAPDSVIQRIAQQDSVYVTLFYRIHDKKDEDGAPKEVKCVFPPISGFAATVGEPPLICMISTRRNGKLFLHMRSGGRAGSFSTSPCKTKWAIRKLWRDREKYFVR